MKYPPTPSFLLGSPNEFLNKVVMSNMPVILNSIRAIATMPNIITIVEDNLDFDLCIANTPLFQNSTKNIFCQQYICRKSICGKHMMWYTVNE